MNCIKCGREIAESQVFCESCLQLMNQCPVKPDMVIQLPNRAGDPTKRPAPRKKARTPEEQISRLKRSNQLLALITAVLLLSTVLLAFLSFDFFKKLDVQRFLGQNYSTIETVK